MQKQIQAAKFEDGKEEDEELKRMLSDNDKIVEEIFLHEDKDKDGYLSIDEFSGPKHDELWTTDTTSIPVLALKQVFGVTHEISLTMNSFPGVISRRKTTKEKKSNK